MNVKNTNEYSEFVRKKGELKKFDIQVDVINIIRADLLSRNLSDEFFEKIVIGLQHLSKSINDFGRYFELSSDVPVNTALPFLTSYCKCVQSLVSFKKKETIYEDLIVHFSDPHNSILFGDYVNLCQNWVAVFPFLVEHLFKSLVNENDLLKKFNELTEATNDLKNRYETFKKSNEENLKKSTIEYQTFRTTVNQKVDDLIKDSKESVERHINSQLVLMTNILEETKKEKDNILREANIITQYKNFGKLEEYVKNKKIWVLRGIASLIVTLIGIPVVSYYTIDNIFSKATELTVSQNGLSLAYIIKSSIPFLGLFSLSSFLLFFLIRLYKSYLHMIDSYKFKQSLIESMLFLVQSKDLIEEERKVIISKVIEAVSIYHSTGFIDSSQGTNDELQLLSNRVFSLLTRDNK